jgi:hypothetical protein
MPTSVWNNFWIGTCCRGDAGVPISCEAESRLVDELCANSKAIISLVAVCAEDVLGHIPLGMSLPPHPGERMELALRQLASVSIMCSLVK